MKVALLKETALRYARSKCLEWCGASLTLVGTKSSLLVDGAIGLLPQKNKHLFSRCGQQPILLQLECRLSLGCKTSSPSVEAFSKPNTPNNQAEETGKGQLISIQCTLSLSLSIPAGGDKFFHFIC